jgi:glycosyltransferase involved in cell wall biosynthesis
MNQVPRTFSVIVPAYNEAALLPRLIDSLEIARARWAGSPDGIEFVVANNQSTDSTAALARARDCVVVEVEHRCIAAARNGGARASTGEVFCFVDADTVVHAETFNEIARVMRGGRCVAGATGARMERMSPGIAVTWALVMPMVRLLGVDTGVVFCRAADFAAVGGYRESLLAAEDIDFLNRLKRLGRPRGQQFMRASAAPAIISTRKFDRYGDWHMLRELLTVPWRLRGGRKTAEPAIRRYWYDDRRDR